MRWSIAPLTLAAACVLLSVATPAMAQDFSITSQAEPANAGRRDLMRQLQAWWDVHAYYPKHASLADEGGTVKLHLLVHTDGNIWVGDVVGSSGSTALDTAASATFHGSFVRPFPPGVPEAAVDLSLQYVLAHRHDQPVAADYKPAAAKRPFTIANDPVTSPVLATMLQRTCTGTVVKEGIRNHPLYGGRHWAQAVFFRKPDGTPWVKFYEGGQSIIAPVTEAGRIVQWTGRAEHPRTGMEFFYQYTVWPDGDNNLTGNIEAYFYTGTATGINTGGTADFTCATETVPAITWSALSVNAYQAPPVDPP